MKSVANGHRFFDIVAGWTEIGARLRAGSRLLMQGAQDSAESVPNQTSAAGSLATMRLEHTTPQLRSRRSITELQLAYPSIAV